MTVTFKFGDNLALAQKVPLTVSDMAFSMCEVFEYRRSVHARS